MTTPLLLVLGESARYYDPSTGRLLTRDPIEAITRSAYGYVYGNPLNATDPSGLFRIPGTDWCVDIADPNFNSNADGKSLKDATGAVADRLGPDHWGVTGQICGVLCVGLEFRNGNLYLIYGMGAQTGMSIGPTDYWTWPAEEESRSIGYGLGPLGGGFDLDDRERLCWGDWSINGGWGLQVGASVQWSRKLLGSRRW